MANDSAARAERLYTQIDRVRPHPGWLTRAETARAVGMSERRLASWVEGGYVAPVESSGRPGIPTFFAPPQIDEIRQALALVKLGHKVPDAWRQLGVERGRKPRARRRKDREKPAARRVWSTWAGPQPRPREEF